MSKRIDLLDELRAFILNETELPKSLSKLDKSKIEKLLEKLKNYYEMNDLETGFIHGEIFVALYLSSGYIIYDAIAGKFSLNTYSLDRYRTRYSKLAQKLIDKI